MKIGGSAITKREYIEKMARAHNAVKEIVATGKCPDCGAGLHNNLAITGWWQCDQYGAEGRRKNNNLPSCSWQGFTE